MIVEVKVPLLSESVSEGTLMSWHKKVGDAVARDEILIDVETDKVVLEVPSPQAGVLVEIIAQDGETVVAEQLLAKIDTAAQAQAAAPAAEAAPAAAAAPASNAQAGVAMPAAATTLMQEAPIPLPFHDQWLRIIGMAQQHQYAIEMRAAVVVRHVLHVFQQLVDVAAGVTVFACVAGRIQAGRTAQSINADA